MNVRAVDRPAAMEEEEEAPARVISTLVRSLTFLCERERKRERERCGVECSVAKDDFVWVTKNENTFWN